MPVRAVDQPGLRFLSPLITVELPTVGAETAFAGECYKCSFSHKGHL